MVAHERIIDIYGITPADLDVISLWSGFMIGSENGKAHISWPVEDKGDMTPEEREASRLKWSKHFVSCCALCRMLHLKYTERT